MITTIIRGVSFAPLLTILFITASVFGQDTEYVGPEPCATDPTVIGYTNSTRLHYDMVAQAFASYSGDSIPGDGNFIYNLCPKTTIDLGSNLQNAEEQVDFPIVPMITGTMITCGLFGFVEDDCVILGGYNQVVFLENFQVTDVIFLGIQFVGYKSVGIIGHGDPRSEALFLSCLFKDGSAYAAADVLFYPGISAPNSDRRLRFGDGENVPRFSNFDHLSWKKSGQFDHSKVINRPRGKRFLEILDKHDFEVPSLNRDVSPRILQDDSDTVVYPAMYLGFFTSDFIDNFWIYYGIRNVAGLIQMSGCTLAYNEAGAAQSGNLYYGQIGLYDGTMFEHNTDAFGPVFVDQYSVLMMNQAAQGEMNVGHDICQGKGVVMESKGSVCMSELTTDGYVCEGSCCEFGDEACDSYYEPSSSPIAASLLTSKDEDDFWDNPNPNVGEPEESFDDEVPTNTSPKVGKTEPPKSGTASASASASASANTSSEPPKNIVLMAVLIPVFTIFAFSLTLYICKRGGKKEQTSSVPDTSNLAVVA